MQGIASLGCRADEAKVLDFQTQQYKLLPAVALSYTCWFVKEDLKKTFDRIYQNEIQKGNFQNVAEVKLFRPFIL